MNITQSKVDDLNSVLTVNIDKEDYKGSVDKMLKDYRKSANVPGFRKGQVPMSLIKKQYEKPLVYEEVNKLLQKSVDDYLQENKISILGNPLPKVNDKFNWDDNPLVFEFELGLSPEFDVNLDQLKLDDYKITVSDEDVNKYVDNFRQRFGSMKDADEVTEDSVLKGVFHVVGEDGKVKEDEEHYHATLRVADLKDKEPFLGKKVEDKVTIDSKDLYEDPHQLQHALGLDHDEAHNFDKPLQFKINQITELVPAEINQELFDKVYGENVVTSEEEFRNKIKEEAEKMYERESDRYLLNEALEKLLDETEIPLPEDFLVRWIEFSNDEANTPEEAKKLLDESEKGLRFQLIEAKLAEKYNLNVTQDEMLDQAVTRIKQQMAMYGAPMKMEDDQLKEIAVGALQDQNEARRIADEVFSEKLINAVKENATLNTKDVSFDEFMEVVSNKKENS